MSEAPKTIKISHSLTLGMTYEKLSGTGEFFPLTKYHHDDTVTALQAKVARLEAALEQIKDRYVRTSVTQAVAIARKALEETP